MTSRAISFGSYVREKRVSHGHSLRKFAELVGVSPTYLSKVEQGNYAPPTVDRVKRIAELLDENVDELVALAGRIPEDLPGIIMQHPTQMPELVREAGELDDDQIQQIRGEIRRLRNDQRRRSK